MLDLSAVISDVFAEMDLPLYVVLEDEEENLTGLERWGWWLSYLAKAFSRARELEENRAAFYEELHDSIRVPAVNYANVYRRGEANPSPDFQAFRMIRKRQLYERKITKQYRLHHTWQKVLRLCETEREKRLLVKFFVHEAPISEEEINRILKKIYVPLMELERRIEEERNMLAEQLFDCWEAAATEGEY